jgi:hypothetical protein
MNWEDDFEVITSNIAATLENLDFDVFGEEENSILVSREGATFRLTIERVSVDHA